jgi:hypothetical protein
VEGTGHALVRIGGDIQTERVGGVDVRHREELLVERVVPHIVVHFLHLLRVFQCLVVDVEQVLEAIGDMFHRTLARVIERLLEGQLAVFSLVLIAVGQYVFYVTPDERVACFEVVVEERERLLGGECSQPE